MTDPGIWTLDSEDGPLLDAGITLPAVFAMAAVAAVAMGLLSMVITRQDRSKVAAKV
jgi:hypothetical protein